MIHRRGKGGYSICGKEYKPKELSLYDCKVVCSECLRLLDKIRMTDTKTTIIQKISINK